ncbi:MAG: DUF4011 domain-containing protein [Leptolyngbya sp. Prado105]|jgi:very-short-patch-repair endonuclease/signal recognition particle GTPase|nr:DUF4011 domain-containing protein [Leptolyngbya sp. Prado105]
MQQPDSHKNLAQKMTKWKAGLADLGRRNPLIKFRQDSTRSLEILTTQPDILFKQIVKTKKVWSFNALEHQEATSNASELKTRQTGQEQLKRLKKLRSETRISLEERGINSLFLAFGTLTWYDKGLSEPLLSPLILVPAKLMKEPRQELYRLSVLEEDLLLNPTLSLKLKQTFGIKLPPSETIQDLPYAEMIVQIRQSLSEQATWEIQENVFLSLFSYAKAALVQDLVDNEARILAHPILQAMSGDLSAYQTSYQEPIPASALDLQVQPEQTFQILDADSSQQVVIEAAKSGASFFVQGPPGTGKSQTIVNMIAELISAGKSVLLVAEKDTALRVVYQRMADCGLSHVCLNLHHSGTTDKRKLVEDLSKTIQQIDRLIEASQGEQHDQFFAQLGSTRQSVSTYLSSLHTRQKPLDKSPFELFGEILQKQEVPDLKVVFQNFSQWSPERLQEVKGLLHQIAQFMPFFNGETTTIWAKSAIRSYSYALELELRGKIADFQRAIALAEAVSEQIQNAFQVEAVLNLEALETYCTIFSHLLDAPEGLPRNWIGGDASLAQAALANLKADVQILESFESYLSQKYSPELFEVDLSRLVDRFEKYSRFWFIRIFNRNYWRDRQFLQKFRIKKRPAFYPELKHDLERAVQVQIVRQQFTQDNYLARQVFGTLFNPQAVSEKELQPLEQTIQWFTRLQQHELSDESFQKMISVLSRKHDLLDLIQHLESSREQIRKGLEFAAMYFDPKEILDRNLPPHRIFFTELKAFLDLLESDLPNFQSWLTYRETCQKLEDFGVKNFLAALKTSKLDPQQWFSVLEKQIYQTCLDAILAQKPELKNFESRVHEQQIRELVKLDYDQLVVARERLKLTHAERWKTWESTSTAQAELSRLRREETKKRQHLPIRRLLNDQQKGVHSLAQVLKPCWMMSPLSVSQYIDPSVIHFDALIFDEASQLRTEDVVSAILRADQVIVIGDRKQLPPTAFFSNVEIEEDSEEDSHSYESVLDECSNFMFGRTLKWHYRSQDERLIAFSNLHFYDAQLVTFPNPIQNPNLGVWFRHVPDGVYDRGKRRDNPREAQVVAELVLKHIQQTPEQSLGIIAFSEAQADSIQEQLEMMSKEHPIVEEFCRETSSQFFLKALENVQGDERDVILLSIGYARDAQGKLSLNFGPLNRIGGERRLNVAITRAKNKITLVSSIVASDIPANRAQSEGVRLLREYLDYAARGGELLQGESYTNQLQFGSPFEKDVYDTLKQYSALKSYTIRTQVGCSGYRIDFAIAHSDRPNEFLLGIECDGVSYHSSPTARDRDRLRQQVLERLGWRIHRIWSTEWFRNKPEQVQRLIEKISHL